MNNLTAYPESREILHFKHFPGSFVLLSSNKSVNTALVFVHGWRGHPYKTWSDFHMLADEVEATKGFYSDCDLFFFSYDSHGQWTEASSHRLLKFVDELILKPNAKHYQIDASTVDPSFVPGSIDVLPEIRKFEKLRFVGHSEGAIVIRKSLIRRFDQLLPRNRRSVLFGERLTLFAPAISGFAPMGLLGIFFRMYLIGPILHACLSGGGGYQDLNDKQSLAELKKETEKRAKSHKLPAFSADILWGTRDKVVRPAKYLYDLDDWIDRNHIDICKPEQEYTEPLEFVARLGAYFPELVGKGEQ